MNTVTASFNTTVTQTTKMSQPHVARGPRVWDPWLRLCWCHYLFKAL